MHSLEFTIGAVRPTGVGEIRLSDTGSFVARLHFGPAITIHQAGQPLPAQRLFAIQRSVQEEAYRLSKSMRREMFPYSKIGLDVSSDGRRAD